jgi:hypothetical protein
MNRRLSRLVGALTKSLAVAGFRKEGCCTFRKDINDVRWYITAYTHPRSKPNVDELIVEVCVFSADLEACSPKFPPSMWDQRASQLRVHLRRLDGVERFRELNWEIRLDKDMDAAIADVQRLIETRALPFLDKTKSTSDMIPLLRSGKFSLSRLRANYDADVWEGKIDPTVQPWKVENRDRKRSWTLDEYISDYKRRTESN